MSTSRPARQRAHLIEKVALKTSRIHEGKKAGKRTKRWRKWIETHKALAEGGGSGAS